MGWVGLGGFLAGLVRVGLGSSPAHGQLYVFASRKPFLGFSLIFPARIFHIVYVIRVRDTWCENLPNHETQYLVGTVGGLLSWLH